jgi:hypothetical protein
MKQLRTAQILLLLCLLLGVTGGVAWAHQPFFEKEDLTAEHALVIKDPTVSTALYATLGTADDMDFFSFTGRRGQRILIGMTIPQIEGQDGFAPTLALIGPGLLQTGAGLLPEAAWPLLEEAAGFELLPPTAEASTFYEPFSRTSYWQRQRQWITLPADGDYMLVVWHSGGDIGRYVLVVGDREIPGGDLLFPLKLPNYWTPVIPAADSEVMAAHESNTEAEALLTPPARESQAQPVVECSWFQRLLALISGKRTCTPSSTP